jgi:TDG/mug DNA glycosylase family protein
VDRRPTRADLQAAYGRTVPDLVRDDLAVLLVGINPSLWSGWSGYHFANPNNRLWPVLHGAGLTPRRLRPHDTDALLECGIGITNLVPRATARADELTRAELRQGGLRLAEFVRTWQPRVVAVLGISAYRTAFAQPKAQTGEQPSTLEGARLWVVPNPSGLNAHHTVATLAEAYAEPARAAGLP